MADYLGRFIKDSATRDTVKEWLLSEVDKQVLSDVYADKDVRGYSTARKAINTAFKNAKAKYNAG